LLVFHFQVLVDGEFSFYVRCVPCGSLLKWKSRDGTSGLKAHLKSCRHMKKEAGGTSRIDSMPGFLKEASGSGDKRLTTTDRNSITNACVEMCAKDIRPFSTIEGTGFKALK